MKVSYFFLLTCLALTSSLSYGSNGAVQSSKVLDIFGGNRVCPREDDMNSIVRKQDVSGYPSSFFFESQTSAVGFPTKAIDEILGVSSSNPFDGLQGELSWENGQAVVVDFDEEAAGLVAPMVEKAEECIERVGAAVAEDLGAFYELWAVYTPDEVYVEEGETVADVIEEEGQMEVAPVAEPVSTPVSLREVEREKLIRLISSILTVGFFGALSVAYFAIVSFLCLFLTYLAEEYEAQADQHFGEILTKLRLQKCFSSSPKALTAPPERLALPASNQCLALPAPPKEECLALSAPPFALPKKKKNNKKKGRIAKKVVPALKPKNEECSSETNVSMEDVYQSCA